MKFLKAIGLWVLSACAKNWYRVKLSVLRLLYRLKAAVTSRLVQWKGKLMIVSLRGAIQDADKDKAETGRKNMVVYNVASGEYEPLQKRLLKRAARADKNTSNKAHTAGRKLMMKRRKKRVYTPERVHQIEEKSLYVTN